MDQRESRSVRKRSFSWAVAVGYTIALGGLAWVVHDVSWRELWSDVQQLRGGWLVGAVLADVASYLVQGIRWRLLLVPVGRLSSLRATQAIYVGLFTNEVMPLRFGELVRTYLMSRWLGVAVSRVASSVAVERLFDGFWLVLAFGCSALFLYFPPKLEQAAGMLGFIIVIAILMLGAFAWFGREGSASINDGGTWSRVRRIVQSMKTELRAIAISKAASVALIISSLILVGQALAFWCVMKAYLLELSVGVAVVVVLIVRIGTMIPNAPANIGSFQFFCVLGLTIFGVDKTVATGYSIVVFAVLTIPLWALGLIAFVRAGLTYGSLRAEVRRATTS